MLSLIEIQSLLISFRTQIIRYKDPSSRRYVAEEYQKRELLTTIHNIVREINKIRDIWQKNISQGKMVYC